MFTPDADTTSGAAPAAQPAGSQTSAATVAAEKPSTAPAAAIPPTDQVTAPPTDAIVDLWFAECIQGTPVGRYTDAYNIVFAAKDELKRRLAKET